MKGIQGLLVAVGLGVVAGDLQLGVPRRPIPRRGEGRLYRHRSEGDRHWPRRTAPEEHLVEIGIPKQSVGKLADFGVPDTAKETVIGQPVSRALSGGMFSVGRGPQNPTAGTPACRRRKGDVDPGRNAGLCAVSDNPGRFRVVCRRAQPGRPDAGRPGLYEALRLARRRSSARSRFLPGQSAGQFRRDAGREDSPGPENVVTVAVKVVNGQLDSKRRSCGMPCRPRISAKWAFCCTNTGSTSRKTSVR